MRIDLHCHSHYSPDALNTFDDLLRRMDQRGLEMVAITDHNTLRGALEFYRRAPDRFLVGEEIKTCQGEVIALFLEEEVPPGLSIYETISRVHAQGGLVGASHPLDRLRSEAMGREVLESIHDQLDFIEAFNARTIFFKDNRLTREMTIRWGLPASAGSDAHVPFEVGRVYVQMPHFENRHDFLDCLAQGQIGGRSSSPLVHLISRYAKWRKCLGI